MENLTEKEIELISYALHRLLIESINRLESEELGDIERNMVENTKKDCKQLLIKIKD